MTLSLRTILNAWNRFFFEPVSPLPLAIYRIAFGLILFAQGLVLVPDYLVWYGDKGALSRAVAPLIQGGQGLNPMLALPPGDAGPIAFFAVYMVAVLFVTVGFLTRASAAWIFFSIVSFHHRDALLLNSSDYFMRLASFYLIFSPAGAALSVDRLIRLARGLEKGRPAPRPPWAMRLIQIQLAFLYWFTFLWKIRGDSWLDGTALYYTSRLPEFWRFPVPYLFEHMWTIKLATWGTLAVEFALGALVWIREFRYWVLLSGVMLHLGIDYSMNIPFFGFIMISAYILFVEQDKWDKLFSWLRHKAGGAAARSPLPVFHDPTRPASARAAELLQALDIWGRLRLWDANDPDARKAFPGAEKMGSQSGVWTQTPEGKWLEGPPAVRFLAASLPLLRVAKALGLLGSILPGHSPAPSAPAPK